MERPQDNREREGKKERIREGACGGKKAGRETKVEAQKKEHVRCLRNAPQRVTAGEFKKTSYD